MYAYEKLMQTEKLVMADLPADAKTGIKGIKDIEKAINLVKKRGSEPSKATLDKLRANDKWVCREIIDYLEDKNDNTEPIPNTPADVIADVKADAADDNSGSAAPDAGAPSTDAAGAAATDSPDAGKPADDKPDASTATTNTAGGSRSDADVLLMFNELKKLAESGKTEYQLEEIKKQAPTVYDVIFETYDDSGDNGVEVGSYSIIETSDKVFTLTK